MIISILSLFLYIVTIVGGLYLDFYRNNYREKILKYYIAWLYIFLCFGYMIGSDWRNYEILYETNSGIERFISEPASYLLFNYSPKIISDFWLFSAICKCLFLFTTIRLTKHITEYWVSCVALMITGQISFLLINNPMRFMIGVIFINLALYIVYDKITGINTRLYYVKLVTFLFVALCFHNSCTFYLLIFFVLPYLKNLKNANRLFVFILYLITMYFTSNIEYMNKITGYFRFIMADTGLNSFSTYSSVDNSNVLSIGNIMRVLFLYFVLEARNSVITNYKNGDIIYAISIVYCFLARIFIIIPTGFRIPMPFYTFYIVYFIMLLRIISKQNLIAKFTISYMLIAFCLNAWNSFEYLPYSNSIPYMIFGHKDLQERYYYNFEQYRERIGENHASYYLYNGI